MSGNSGLTAGIPTAQTAFAPVQEYAQHVIKSGSLYAGFFYNIGCRKNSNSSRKLKEKSQPQGGTFLFLKETQEKNSILPKIF